MFKALTNLFGKRQTPANSVLAERVEPQAATQLAPLPPPKVKPGSRSLPSFFKTSKPSPSQALQRDDRRLTNLDTLTYRQGTDTRKIIRDFAAASPALSSAIWSYLRLIPERFTAIAVSGVDGSIDRDATALLQQVIQRINTMGHYDDGFSQTTTLKSLSETLARELMLYGSCAFELVLDKGRLPLRFDPVSVTTIEFFPDGNGVRPVQKVGDVSLDLDTPSFFYLSLDQDPLDPYSASPIESAIKPVLFLEQWSQDLHKIISRVIHPRQKVVIDEEKFRKNLSPEAMVDSEVAREEMNAVITEIENRLTNLNVDEALVYFDSLGFSVEQPSTTGLAGEYEFLQQMGQSRLVSGSKVFGTILGFSNAGSSNIASSEVALFTKSASSAIKSSLDQIYSRAFTLALRLFGLDVVVKFEYEAISMRNEVELEAHLQTRQMRILEQLSLGLITDDEAALLLTGKLPPQGYKPLAGTMFKSANYEGSQVQEDSNSGSTFNQQTKADTPAVGRGQNNRRADLYPIEKTA